MTDWVLDKTGQAELDAPSRAAKEQQATRVTLKLREVAKSLEDTAYEEAGGLPAALTSQLIMISADLERLSRTIDRLSKDD